MADNTHTDWQRSNDITAEEVKACPAFAHFTDEEAQQVIETLITFAKIVYDCCKNQRKTL
ncbi:hypothetical protein HQ865_22815 [Mucilaginibacter mali]|uniref:Uncharacterized protein n=1 Tax=Mucilaginibacter mali TaxID=2740462 RepID=A0A7D4TXL9_9SPHI|nr:hypothetical protein [Mucilaginibacter mali]QKJ32475.1 hypothetical protein HQ865_22815 [Mucilaginibacter mali]